MPIMVDDDGRRDRCARRLRDEHGVQTSLLYPAVHEFTAYRERFGAHRLPRTERVARTEVTIPLFAHMTRPTQDRVVGALREALRVSWAVPLTDVVDPRGGPPAVAECLETGWLTMGPRTQRFEAALGEWTGAPHAVAVSSGTAALHLACRAPGSAPGDEVIVPALTFVATANAPRYCGAGPVLCDVESPERPNLDRGDVERCLTPAHPRRDRRALLRLSGRPRAAARALRRARARADRGRRPGHRRRGRARASAGTAGALGCLSLLLRRSSCASARAAPC